MVEVCFLELDGRDDALVACLLAQPLRAVLQDHRTVCLRQENEERPSHSRKDGAHPEAPSPRDNRDVT